MLVRDYDEELAYYRDKLGFETIVDMQAGERRYVHLRLPTQKGIGIWPLKADTGEQPSRVGRQTAGQPCAVIYTDDFHATHYKLASRGESITREPREQSGAFFAHFEYIYCGNEFVLVELSTKDKTR